MDCAFGFVCDIQMWWRGVVCEERKWMKLAQLCVAVLQRHYNRTDMQVNANDGPMRYHKLVYIHIVSFFCCGAATQSGSWPPHS